MAKQELFRPSLMGIIVRAYGAFPIRRDKLDREALRYAFGLLNKGQVLGMFPEGKRSFPYHLQEMQPGTAFIAAHSGVPIIPVGISGSEQVKGLGFIVRRPRITVRIGRSFTLPSGKNNILNRPGLNQHSGLIMKRIAELLPRAYLDNHDFPDNMGSSNEN
jgi:1-acyl-sn-glycerol-3-phosphate acyltransferase